MAVRRPTLSEFRQLWLALAAAVGVLVAMLFMDEVSDVARKLGWATMESALGEHLSAALVVIFLPIAVVYAAFMIRDNIGPRLSPTPAQDSFNGLPPAIDAPPVALLRIDPIGSGGQIAFNGSGRIDGAPILGLLVELRLWIANDDIQKRMVEHFFVRFVRGGESYQLQRIGDPGSLDAMCTHEDSLKVNLPLARREIPYSVPDNSKHLYNVSLFLSIPESDAKRWMANPSLVVVTLVAAKQPPIDLEFAADEWPPFGGPGSGARVTLRLNHARTTPASNIAPLGDFVREMEQRLAEAFTTLETELRGPRSESARIVAGPFALFRQSFRNRESEAKRDPKMHGLLLRAIAALEDSHHGLVVATIPNAPMNVTDINWQKAHGRFADLKMIREELIDHISCARTS